MSLIPKLCAATIALLTVTSPSLALDVTLDGASSAPERVEARYRCADGRTVPVTYINAEPIALAIVPATEGTPLVFARVLSASGSRYAANEFVWWTKGSDATLYNITEGPNAPGVTCSQANP